MLYLKEDTLARFLEIPENEASSILFHMASQLAAFPFLQDAPAVLGFEQMIMVVVIMTERYTRVLKKGSRDRTKLFFRSLAVYDRHQSEPKIPTVVEESETAKSVAPRTHVAGFKVDDPVEDEDEDDDELALSALESLDAIDVFKQGDLPIAQSSIPTDNLRRLIMLLLLIAPLDAQESLSRHADRVTGEKLKGLRQTADNVLAAFINVEKAPGIKIHAWNTVIPISLPFMFNGFNPLFEHFLFSKNIDLSRRRDNAGQPIPTHSSLPPDLEQPLLPKDGEILDVNVLSQLSFFIPGSSLFRRLRQLYSGGEHGFSMGSFETHVFNWRAPTILLVTGSRINDPPTGGQERAFSETLPPKRLPDSSKAERVTYGAYISRPWQQTYKECFGDSSTILFQLSPVHEVFPASSVNPEYLSFTRPPTAHTGIGIGCPHPKQKATNGLSPHVALGAVSLWLDSAFEFGVFTHNYTSGGGAFRNSEMRRTDWQDRFEIESLEVWGCGGDDEAKAQRERWEWEEKEAEARRRINIGKGDIEADRYA